MASAGPRAPAPLASRAAPGAAGPSSTSARRSTCRRCCRTAAARTQNAPDSQSQSAGERSRDGGDGAAGAAVQPRGTATFLNSLLNPFASAAPLPALMPGGLWPFDNSEQLSSAVQPRAPRRMSTRSHDTSISSLGAVGLPASTAAGPRRDFGADSFLSTGSSGALGIRADRSPDPRRSGRRQQQHSAGAAAAVTAGSREPSAEVSAALDGQARASRQHRDGAQRSRPAIDDDSAAGAAQHAARNAPGGTRAGAARSHATDVRQPRGSRPPMSASAFDEGPNGSPRSMDLARTHVRDAGASPDQRANMFGYPSAETVSDTPWWGASSGLSAMASGTPAGAVSQPPRSIDDSSSMDPSRHNSARAPQIIPAAVRPPLPPAVAHFAPGDESQSVRTTGESNEAGHRKGASNGGSDGLGVRLQPEESVPGDADVATGGLAHRASQLVAAMLGKTSQSDNGADVAGHKSGPSFTLGTQPAGAQPPVAAMLGGAFGDDDSDDGEAGPVFDRPASAQSDSPAAARAPVAAMLGGAFGDSDSDDVGGGDGGMWDRPAGLDDADMRAIPRPVAAALAGAFGGDDSDDEGAGPSFSGRPPDDWMGNGASGGGARGPAFAGAFGGAFGDSDSDDDGLGGGYKPPAPTLQDVVAQIKEDPGENDPRVAPALSADSPTSHSHDAAVDDLPLSTMSLAARRGAAADLSSASSDGERVAGAAPSTSIGISNMLSDPGAALSAALVDASSASLVEDGGLRSLLEGKPTATMEKLFHMWIRSADITMTETVIGRGSYGQVRRRAASRALHAAAGVQL